MAENKNANEPVFTVAGFVARDPVSAAMLAKTVKSPTARVNRDGKGNRKAPIANVQDFKNKLGKRAKRNSDAKMTLKLLPDIELAVQILVSSILSPADMMTTELNYVGPNNIYASELTSTLTGKLKTYFEEEYKIKPLLPEILRDIIAEKGAYPVCVIPENAIDEFINGDLYISKESLEMIVDSDGKPKNLGILGSPTESRKQKIKGSLALEGISAVQATDKIDTRLHFSFESAGPRPKTTYIQDDNSLVTDNIMVLKFPQLHEKLKKQAIRKAVQRTVGNFSLESEISDLRIEQQIYRTRTFNHEPVASLKPQSQLGRKFVGKPMVMKLPTEAVLPVFVPGDVKKHIGYFVLLDEEGNPLAVRNEDYYYSTAASEMGSAARSSLSTNIVNRINSNMGGGNLFDPSNHVHLDMAGQIYADLVERDLIARIKNGVHSTSVQIAGTEEIYRVMFCRTMSRKFTQILYIPADYMTYMAFKYDDDGIGRSLLDESSVINTLRSVLMFADTLASVKNSIGRTKVEMNIPEDDPNPMKTIEMAQEEIVRSRQLGLPLGVTNPTDITEFIQRAGFEWAWTGGNTALPDLKFSFENTQSSIARPDQELQDNLRKHSIMNMGLSPETVDTGFAGEFATTVVSNNILLSKRVMQYQEQLTPLISDHLRKYAMFSQELVDELREIVEGDYDAVKFAFTDEEQEMLNRLPDDQKKKYTINRTLMEFISGFEVILPKPASVSLTNQLEEVNTYKDALELAVDQYINSEFMTDATAGGVSMNVDTIKAMIKSHFMRKFFAEKGFLPELSELVSTGEDDSPQLNLLKEITQHVESMVRSCVTNLAILKPIADAATADIDKMGTPDGEVSSSDDTDTSSDMGDGDDLGGMDDLGGLDDTAPTGEQPPEGEEEPDATPDL